MSRQTVPGCLLFTLLWVIMGACAQAQWLVYELRFQAEAESVNFSHYTGAYMIAPVQGGPASVIFTTEEGGQFYAVSDGSGKFFMAANQNATKAVFTALAQTHTAQAFYSASGYLNRTLLLESPAGARSWRVAEVITGRLLAADDESTTGPTADGSLGMTGSALIYGLLREDLTANATSAYHTLTEVTRYVVDLLEKYGYSDDVGAVPDGSETQGEIADPQVIDSSLFPAPALTTQP